MRVDFLVHLGWVHSLAICSMAVKRDKLKNRHIADRIKTITNPGSPGAEEKYTLECRISMRMSVLKQDSEPAKLDVFHKLRCINFV